MAQVTLKGSPVQVSGNLPEVGSKAHDFTLVGAGLADKTLASFAGKRKVLNIFPSVDTPTCATSVRKFNTQANDLSNAVVCASRLTCRSPKPGSAAPKGWRMSRTCPRSAVLILLRIMVLPLQTARSRV